MDGVDREVIVRVVTDVVTLVRARKVVLRESLRLLSVAALAEVVVILLLLLRAATSLNCFVVEYFTLCSSVVSVEAASSRRYLPSK